jgi:fumarylacetoacetase
MSWVPVSATSHFPIQNLPFGIFSTAQTPWLRAGVAIGDNVLDLFCLSNHGLLDGLGYSTQIFGESTLNSFMELERSAWRATRQRLQDLLSDKNVDIRLSSNEHLKSIALIPLTDAIMHMPAKIGDYTDFYSSREHATNVGIMFRGVDNALQPNWLHLPVGYHGRASSVVITGTDVVRPQGQLQADAADPKKGAIFGACRLLDFELEMGVFLGGKGNELGRPLTMDEAEDKIFGLVLLNDWSARDIQAWEYVPLGPFTAKNFCTSISPWIVTLDALDAFRTETSAGPVQTNPDPLPYLFDKDYARSTYDIRLEVALKGPRDSESSLISVSNLRYMYWNMRQQLVHHSVTGCPMVAGDLLGSGTISGPTPDSFGSMLELSWRGAREIALNKSVEEPAIRKFLKDGDEIIMTGFAQGDGYRIGFGDVSGKILPAGSRSAASSSSAASAAPALPSALEAKKFKLYSYWRSTCSWRVRLALELKGIKYEYSSVDLLPLVGNTTKTLSSEFKNEVNPLEQIPVLEITNLIDGSVDLFAQSVAIIEYLEEALPGTTKLFPENLKQRQRARQIAEIVNSGIQPLQSLALLRQVKAVELVAGTDGQSKAGTSHEFASDAINRGFFAIESLLAELAPASSPLFAAGTPVPSVADIFLVPQVYNAGRFGIDMSLYPNIQAIVEKCKDIEAFKRSVPEAQPDAML